MAHPFYQKLQNPEHYHCHRLLKHHYLQASHAHYKNQNKINIKV